MPNFKSMHVLFCVHVPWWQKKGQISTWLLTGSVSCPFWKIDHSFVFFFSKQMNNTQVDTAVDEPSWIIAHNIITVSNYTRYWHLLFSSHCDKNLKHTILIDYYLCITGQNTAGPGTTVTRFNSALLTLRLLSSVCCFGSVSQLCLDLVSLTNSQTPLRLCTASSPVFPVSCFPPALSSLLL